MTKQYPVFVKRALAFVLAFVLMLSLAPTVTLPVDAAVETDGWEYNTNYMEKFKTAEFSSTDSDLIFIDNQAYDWKVYFWMARIFPSETLSSQSHSSTAAGRWVTAMQVLPGRD